MKTLILAAIRCFLMFTAVAALSVAYPASALTIYPTNDGFEQPDVGSGPLAYQYFPSSPGWIFSGPNGNGIAANGSDFFLAGATNGNHNGITSTAGQAAFLQFGDGTLASGNISQILTLPPGHWILFLSLEGRVAYGANGVNVFLNGIQIGGTLLPAHLGSFNNTSVDLGNLSAGTYTLAFAGNDIFGGDRTTFIDNVRFATSVPDSGSTILLLIGSFASVLILQRMLLRPA
jgi:hypothetical protein